MIAIFSDQRQTDEKYTEKQKRQKGKGTTRKHHMPGLYVVLNTTV